MQIFLIPISSIQIFEVRLWSNFGLSKGYSPIPSALTDQRCGENRPLLTPYSERILRCLTIVILIVLFETLLFQSCTEFDAWWRVLRPLQITQTVVHSRKSRRIVNIS